MPIGIGKVAGIPSPKYVLGRLNQSGTRFDSLIQCLINLFFARDRMGQCHSPETISLTINCCIFGQRIPGV